MILRSASFGRLFGQSGYDWVHKTAPQKNVLNREVVWSRGKGLGGTSAINFFLYTKPSARELDDIERLGNPGWNWKTINKYMQKSEKFTHPTESMKTKYNLRSNSWKTGTDGPILTAFPGKINAAELDIQQTLITAGLPVAVDPLGGDTAGVFFAPNTIDPNTKTRTYATPAYYLPHASRKNLRIVVSTLVTEVLFETVNNTLTAVGVKVLFAGVQHLLHARKEVILSAGTIKTPQLLELSGIGKQTILEKVGIPTRLDLPVGENMQEHFFASVVWELKENTSFETLDILRDPKIAAEHIELHKKGEGLFTLGCTGVAFVPLTKLSPNAKELNAAIKARITAKLDKVPPGMKEQYEIMLQRIDDETPACELISIPGSFKPSVSDPTKKYITLTYAVNHPWSRGSIHIDSTDPCTDPAVDPRYFEEEYDLAALMEMGKWSRKLADQEPLRSIIAKEVYPGPEVSNDEQLKSFIKQTLSTTWHTCGTASMLPRDKGGVVDHNLKVYGTTNLRVVDLSILPLHVASHTIALVYALAEKAADIIKSDG